MEDLGTIHTYQLLVMIHDILCQLFGVEGIPKIGSQHFKTSHTGRMAPMAPMVRFTLPMLSSGVPNFGVEAQWSNVFKAYKQVRLEGFQITIRNTKVSIFYWVVILH